MSNFQANLSGACVRFLKVMERNFKEQEISQENYSESETRPRFGFTVYKVEKQESGLHFLRNLTKLLEFYSRLELLIQAAVFEYFARFKDSSFPHQSGELLKCSRASDFPFALAALALALNSDSGAE